MDLVTLMAYPIVFMHGKLVRYSTSKENIACANLLINGSVTPGK